MHPLCIIQGIFVQSNVPAGGFCVSSCDVHLPANAPHASGSHLLSRPDNVAPGTAARIPDDASATYLFRQGVRSYSTSAWREKLPRFFRRT